jgi:hypothetical protein
VNKGVGGGVGCLVGSVIHFVNLFLLKPSWFYLFLFKYLKAIGGLVLYRLGKTNIKKILI